MSDLEKIYTMRFRYEAQPPEGWQKTLANTPGITLISSLDRQARIKGDLAAIENALKHFPDDIIIEEDLPRHF